MRMRRIVNCGLSGSTEFFHMIWGENVSELAIGGKKTNNKKLYTVLSYWGVFTFRTRCKILIFLVCIVASFMLSCM